MVGSIAAMHAGSKALARFFVGRADRLHGNRYRDCNGRGAGGGMLHVFNHALIKVALFIGVGCVLYAEGP